MSSQYPKSGDNYFRRLVARVTALSHNVRLRRQFAEIEQRSLELPQSYREQLADLVRRECDAVAQSREPAAYGSQIENNVTTPGIDVGMDRARSDNVQIRMRGLALWLALAYHETDGGGPQGDEELHRQILRVMRELKVFSSRPQAGGMEL